MKIVILDGHTTNPGDLSWQPIERLGNCTVYEHTPPELVVERAHDAEIVLTNKSAIDRAHMDSLPKLEFIGVLATGYNVVDVAAAKDKGVVVSNAAGYSTMSVVQHTYALILELMSKASAHSHSVKEDDGWASQEHFSYTLGSVSEISGKTIGIIGFGTIGQRVGEVALAFGMTVLANRSMEQRPPEGVEYVALDTLLDQSDIITLHCPLTPENQGMVNTHFLLRMKRSAILINTARGGLINEKDLYDGLNSSQIAGAGLDVLSVEPPSSDHVLLSAPNCLITPHIAWASIEARKRLIDITTRNVRSYLIGEPINVVNP